MADYRIVVETSVGSAELDPVLIESLTLDDDEGTLEVTDDMIGLIRRCSTLTEHDGDLTRQYQIGDSHTRLNQYGRHIGERRGIFTLQRIYD